MNSLKEISKVIKRSKSIALFTHISPDCDALGSTFGLFLALTKLGKSVKIFIKDKFTDNQKLLFDESKVNKERCEISDFDLFIMSDGSALNRLGDYEYIFNDKTNTIVLDHHVCTKLIGKYNFIDTECSSCCEIILKLLISMKIEIDKDIATCLYCGLSSDTGAFINSNVTENSFYSAYLLSLKGADTSKINEILYRSDTLKDLEFQKLLLNNFKVIDDCAYIAVDANTLKEMNGVREDCSGFSRILANIKGIKYSFSLIEDENGNYRLSMRSKIGHDVRVVAEKLGGGGHICAAGATINASNIEEAIKLVLKTLGK